MLRASLVGAAVMVLLTFAVGVLRGIADEDPAGVTPTPLTTPTTQPADRKSTVPSATTVASTTPTTKTTLPATATTSRSTTADVSGDDSPPGNSEESPSTTHWLATL